MATRDPETHASASSPAAPRRAVALLVAFVLGGCGNPDASLGAAPPTSDPVAPPEEALPTAGELETLRARTEVPLPAAVMWKPGAEEAPGLDPYLAPLLYREVAPGAGEVATEPAIGELVQGPADALVVDPDRPTVYFVDERVVAAGAERRRLTFVWFHAARPEAAPRPQGLRITFGQDGMPKVYEALADESGARVAYVAGSLEEAARSAFGAPLPTRRHAIEGEWDPGFPVVVGRVVADGPVPMGPFVYQREGSTDLVNLHCRCETSQVVEIAGTREYALRPLAALTRRGLAPAWPEPSVLAGLRLPPGF